MPSAVRVRAVAILGLSLCAPAVLRAQAWLPDKGEGSVTVETRALVSHDPPHLDRNGKFFGEEGRISSGTLVVGVEYGLTERFVLDANVAFVAAKYKGADLQHGPFDTGIYHGDIQDARVALRFRMPTRGALALAPFVGGIIPTHDYETRGHSATGGHLKALELGMAVGRDLGPAFRSGYVQSQYSFAFVEHVGGMSINRSNLDIEGGFAVSRVVTLTLATAVQRTHGGLESPLRLTSGGAAVSDEVFATIWPVHDRVAKANHILVRSGATIAVSRAISAYGTGVWMISGQNTHSVEGVTVGIAWAFSRGLSFGGGSAARAAAERRTRMTTGS